MDFHEKLRQGSQGDKVKAISTLASQHLGCVQVGREQSELSELSETGCRGGIGPIAYLL